MAVPDQVRNNVRSLAGQARTAANASSSAEDRAALLALAGSLEAWDRSPSGSAPISEFFHSVGKGVRQAQEELDRESAEYTAANAPIPTMFRIPKVEAEFHFAMERSSSSGFNVIVAARKTESQELFENRVRFDIVAAPPPPADTTTRSLGPRGGGGAGLAPRTSADFSRALAGAGGPTASPFATAEEREQVLSALKQTAAAKRASRATAVARWLTASDRTELLVVRVAAAQGIPPGFIVLGLRLPARPPAGKAQWVKARASKPQRVAALYIDPANPLESAQAVASKTSLPGAVGENAVLILAAIEAIVRQRSSES